MAASNSKLKLKLLIDKRYQRVVFAEANKEFVDFLCSLTTLPLASVVKLLTKNGMIGGMGDLCDSIGSLDDKYIKSSENMDYILNPRPPTVAFQSPLWLTNNESGHRKVYMCLNRTQRKSFSGSLYTYVYETTYHPVVSELSNTPCPKCGKIMSQELLFVDSYRPEERVASSSTGCVDKEQVVACYKINGSVVSIKKMLSKG